MPLELVVRGMLPGYAVHRIQHAGAWIFQHRHFIFRGHLLQMDSQRGLHRIKTMEKFFIITVYND